MNNLWFTVVVITCGLRVSSDVIENLKLHEVFRKPKDFSSVNFDHLEILEKNNFEPALAKHEHEESSAHSKLHPRSVANAQVMLRFGGDDIKGRNTINKNPSPDLTTRLEVPCCQQCQQPHYQIVNQYKPPYQLMPPYGMGQYPVPAYLPLPFPPNPYYPYYCPCFNNVPGMIPNHSTSAHSCPFLGGNPQTKIASIINVNHPKILQTTDLTDEVVPENNGAKTEDDPIAIPDLEDTYKRPKGYKDPSLSKYEKDYIAQLKTCATKKTKPVRDEDDVKMDDKPITIPDLEDTFKRPKGYKDPSLSKFEKDYKKRLGPGAENKPKPPRRVDGYEIDEAITIPDLEDTFKRPKGYKDPSLSKFEKDYIKKLGPSAENKPKPKPIHGNDDYEMDDEPVTIPDLEDTFKRPKGYTDSPLSKFEKDYKKRLGPGAENKPNPHYKDDYKMNDEPITIPDLEDTFKRPKGYTDPPLSKFEKDYIKKLGPGAENKPKQKPKEPHSEDDYKMNDEPITIPDLEDTFKRPEGYTDPPLSKFEKDYIKNLRSGNAKKPNPPNGNDKYKMDDEPITIPDLEDTFKRPEGYTDPPLSKFEKDYIKKLGPGAENKPKQKPKEPHSEDDYKMNDEPITIPDLEDTFKRPEGYTDPPLSKFEKDYIKNLRSGNAKKPNPTHGNDKYKMDDEPITIPDLEDTFKRPEGYTDPPLSKFEKDYIKKLGPGAENKPKRKPKTPHSKDDYEMNDEPITIPDLEDTFKRPEGYTDPPLSKFEKDYIKNLRSGNAKKPNPPNGNDKYKMDDEPITIPDLEDTFKRPEGYTDLPLSKFEKDYIKKLGPGAENKPKRKPKTPHSKDDYEMNDEPITIPDLEDTFKRPEGYTDPPLSKFEKDYIKNLRSGNAKKPNPPHGNDKYKMDDEPITIPDLEDTFKRPEGYTDPPLSKFEKDYIKNLRSGNAKKPNPPHGNDKYKMDDEPITIPDLEDTFKRPEGYTDPPLSKFEKDYIKNLRSGNAKKPKPPHGDDKYKMDDEPITIPDLEDTFKRPEGYTDPPLSKFEKDYIKNLRSGDAKKTKPPHGNDNYKMDDEPITIPDLEDTFKRPEGYTDPPLSKFEKDYLKQLEQGPENKPKPIIKNANQPGVIAPTPEGPGSPKNEEKGRKGNDKNKNKGNKRGKVQTKRGNKEEKPVFDSTVMKDKPVFEETIETESPINTDRKMEEAMFDQCIKSEKPLKTSPIKEINDEIFRQKIPLSDCECHQHKKPQSVRRELEGWLNNSLVPFDCDKCGRKLLVSYPISEDLNTHYEDAPLRPLNCPCCQLKGFCDCKNCQCHRDPGIPYGQRFSTDIDSLVKMAGDNWAPGGYYSDPHRKILFKPPTVFNFITHSNPAHGVQGTCGFEEPQLYKLVPEYQIVPKEVKPLGVTKLIPTETFVCCKVPGDRMICQRQYIAGNQPVLIPKEEA